MKAPAYMNHGRWVADCPVAGCTDARAVYPEDQRGVPSPVRVLEQTCRAGHPFVVDMPPPDTEVKIVTALAERLSDTRKNWFPKNHPLALALGLPHGQSVRELREEAAAGEEADAQALATKRAEVLVQARALGISADDILAAMKGA